MAFKSVVTMEKPLQHISLADWSARVNCLRNVADARRTDALNIQTTSRMVRDEARIEGHWATCESNEALTERIAELTKWRGIISTTYERVENETHALKAEKVLMEQQLDALSGPIAMIGDIISMRDSRLGSELTYDEPDEEIKKELMTLESNQRLLADRCQKAWEKLNRLEDVRIKIAMDIESKLETINLERTQRDLHRNSMEISFKMDAVRSPKNCLSYESWLEHTKSIIQLAENELADAAAMRESLFVCRERARTILQAQQDHTEFITRKRIFETQRARNELEFQQAKMKDAMESAMRDLAALTESLRDKTNILKLAETRLENRALRRGAELCFDYVHDALCLEVEKQREIHRCLRAKIEESQLNFNLMSEHALKIKVDLEKKQHALMTDKRALEIREDFKKRQTGIQRANPSAATDNNILITNMANIVAKI